MRHVSGLEDISSLTLDHGGGDKPPDLDTLASHRSLGEYGSRRKTDRARAAMRCSKLEHETDDVLLVFGTYKAWPDQGRMDDTFMRYRFTEDSVRAEPSAKPVGSYPESITASDTLAAWMYDEFTEAAVPDPDTGETHERAMTVQELVKLLRADDRPNVTEAKVRNRLNEHPDAFVRVDSQLSRGRHQALWQRIPPA